MNKLKVISALKVTGFCMVQKYSGTITTEDGVMIILKDLDRNEVFTNIVKINK